MFKIRTYNQLSVKGLNRFDREHYEVASELPHPDAFLLRSHDLHQEAFPETLKAIARAGADMILTYYAPQAAQWLAEK